MLTIISKIHEYQIWRFLLFALILIPSTVNFLVPLYDKEMPNIFGLPFFYWFQTNWLVICSGFYLEFVCLKKKEEERNAAASGVHKFN
jgi:hypothetical protein